MADIFQSGISALRTFQRALAVTANNVANAQTEGYSRQRIDLVAREPQGFGYGFVGSGVEVASIRRIADQYAIGQLRNSNASLGELDAFNRFAEQVDNIIGDTNTGIAKGLTDFFGAWQNVANDPSSTSARQLLISQANTLAERFATTDTRLNDLERDVNANIQESLAQINSLASSLAKVNEKIVAATAGFNQPPNELLDQRDTLLNELAQLTAISTTNERDGAINVFVGNGQALVTRSQSFSLGATPNAFDPSRLDIVYRGTSGDQPITGALTEGGALGGLLQARTALIDPARNTLGQVATSLAMSVNAQHRQGMDLRGALGGDLFTISAPQALNDAANDGNGSVAVSISNLSQLTADEYFLSFDGTNYALRNASSGQTIPMTGAGSNASPFVAEGLSIVVSGTPQTGDRFYLRPTRLGAASLDVALSDPARIAAAAPLRTEGAVGNAGTGAISTAQVQAIGNVDLLDPVSIQFLTPTTYSIDGGAAVAYTPGGNIDLNGWRIQINGAPAAGDTFTVRSNAGGVGDGRNALSLGALQSQDILNNGTASISDTFSSLVGTIGTRAHQANINFEAQSAITSQAREQVLSVSGVNLDEEAADMMRWQQAYQAAAQTISVANTLFQTLMQAFR